MLLYAIPRLDLVGCDLTDRLMKILREKKLAFVALHYEQELATAYNIGLSSLALEVYLILSLFSIWSNKE